MSAVSQQFVEKYVMLRMLNETYNYNLRRFHENKTR
jgi:hypothetical protein